jgi:putative SOS response-associated peptidase YedK
MVVLNRADWATWLDTSQPATHLLRALPVGSLERERVR